MFGLGCSATQGDPWGTGGQPYPKKVPWGRYAPGTLKQNNILQTARATTYQMAHVSKVASWGHGGHQTL